MKKIEALYETVNLHAGTGNTTWIFEQAKRNPKCRILFSSRELAKLKEKEYCNWFKKVNKRKANQKEIPHFCAIGEVMYHTCYGFRVPLIIDNSCFDQGSLKKALHESYEKGKTEANDINEAGWKIHITKTDSHESHLIDFVNSIWIMPFRKRIIEKIKSI